MRKFAWGIVAGAVSVFGGLAAAYGAIATIWPDNLPAPAITRLVLFDEKLRFLRQHPEASPTIFGGRVIDHLAATRRQRVRRHDPRHRGRLSERRDRTPAGTPDPGPLWSSISTSTSPSARC